MVNMFSGLYLGFRHLMNKVETTKLRGPNNRELKMQHVAGEDHAT